MPRLIPALGQTGEQPLEMDWPDLPPIPTPTYVVTQCSSFSAHLTGVRQAQLEDASEHEKQMSVWALSTHSTAANTANRNAFMVRRWGPEDAQRDDKRAMLAIGLSAGGGKRAPAPPSGPPPRPAPPPPSASLAFAGFVSPLRRSGGREGGGR